MRTLITVAAVALSIVAAACKSTGHCPSCTDAQALVERVAAENPSVTRLSVHCPAMGGAGPVACASTAPEKRGKPSDPEDLEAMKTGKPVVRDEPGAIDVTVPIMTKDGMATMACGVTVKNDGTARDQQIAKATAIAKTVETGLAACGASCCCCGAK